ncbi:unnamed protein product [Larinioides sclopetarius]|uniref:Uncharacterized protein n=1 Tax=Larinioides sclopetarius TaxID=280406 RepID=A0AAV2BK62_9ARAC
MMFRVCLSAVKTGQWLPSKESHVGVFDVTCIRSIVAFNYQSNRWKPPVRSWHSKNETDEIENIFVSHSETANALETITVMYRAGENSTSTNMDAYLCFQSYWISSKLRLQGEKRRFQRHPEFYSKHTENCFNAVTSQNVQDGSLSVQDDNLNSAFLSSISENVMLHFSIFAKRYVLAKNLRLCNAK